MTKKVSTSITEVSYLVLPNDTNPLGFLRGGVLMEWMDIASEITAQKHAHCVALTIAIDTVSFKSPIRSGDTVHIRAQMTRAFNTSMEIYVQVWASSLPDMQIRKTNEAFFTFVAIEEDGNPREIPSIEPTSEEEEKLYTAAMERRKNKIEVATTN
ncbi:MAG: acyl-CoA thioesterase [Cyclobacteriaceae bacterium]